MKINRQICLLFFVFFFSSCGNNSLQLRNNFTDPPLANRMNQNIHNIPQEPVAQDSLIQLYLENGYGGFALNVPYQQYLTEEGMQATLRFCKKAKNNGMELWLYDEKGYPSGNAGDLVIKSNPDWECKGFYIKDTLTGGGTIQYKMPPGKLIQVNAFPVLSGKTDFSGGLNLDQNIHNGYLVWDAPHKDYRILAVSTYRLYESFQASHKGGSKVGAPYPSLLIPEVTEKFIEITHEKYSSWFGEDLGRYFTSTFTDEPSLMAVPFPRREWAVIPWDRVLSNEMETRYGYRPENKLEWLLRDPGPTGQKIRYQYYRTLGDLISRNYFKTLRTWCEEHNFQSGGHLLLEETMMAHVPLYGDIMACYRELNAPGIDILSCKPRNTPVHSPKLASSAMELTGNTLVMSEPCPVADRAVDGKEPPASVVRGHLNILMAGGVTDFNNYLQLSNSNREEKKEINLYTGRITSLLTGTHTLPDVGILYPIESLWTKYIPQPQKVAGWDSVSGGYPEAIAIEQCFRNTSRFMFKNAIEYTYLDSKALINSTVEKDCLAHKYLNWDIIILPAVSTLPAKAWNRLEQYILNGGKIIALQEMPRNSESEFPDSILSERFAHLFETLPNAVFIPDADPSELKQTLNKWITPSFSIQDSKLPLRIAHKQKGKSELFFLYNDSEDSISTTLSFNIQGKITEWDPSNGTITKINNPSILKLNPWHGKIYTVK